MGTIHAERATLNVPAEYLEDVRCAVAEEIRSDGDWVRTEERQGAREDRDGAVRCLREDMRSFEQLVAATEDTELIAERQHILHLLEATCRLLTERLADQMQYAPLDTVTVLQLAERLRWAAAEAAGVYPAVAVA